MIDYRIVVAFILMFVLLPYLTIMIMVAREERRTLKTLEEAMIKEKYTKHGHWVIVDDYLSGDDAEIHYKCSNCGRDVWYIEKYKAEAKYCFNCGAKMDGDQDE